MFHRLLQLSPHRSSFLFGARGTGKSTHLRRSLPTKETHFVNLLEPDTEEDLSRDPRLLEREVLALPASVSTVVVDEVQKAPRLLDVVHNLIETHRVPQRFVLTGSSARKLRRGGANLLAGRASMRSLFPLVSGELGSDFDESIALRFGGLPTVWNARSDADRIDYLRAYAQTYLREEIRLEQAVRRIEPFRRFLEVAAQSSGNVLNYASIARDIGGDPKTVEAWFGVLEDTLIGYHLDAYHSSVRKQLQKAPKFYLFDVGVARALGFMLNVTPHPSTGYFGELFEHLVIGEIRARNAYEERDWQLSYLLTKGGVEIDLVVQRPGQPLALIEIKSADLVRDDHAANLLRFADDFPDADLLLFSRDPRAKQFGRVRALPWRDGIQAI